MSDGRKFGSVEVIDRLQLGALEAGAVVLDLVAEDALEADDVGDQQVAHEIVGEVPAVDVFHAGAGPRPLLVNLRRLRVLLRILQVAGEEGGVVGLGAGAVDDDVLAPAVEDVAVRIGEAASLT